MKKAQAALTRADVAELRRTIDHLEAQQRQLESDLEQASSKRAELEDEIAILRAKLTEAEERADDLARQLREQLESKEREHARVEIRIGELHLTQRIVTDERNTLVHVHDSLREHVDALKEDIESDDTANWYASRARAERQKREKVERDLADLRAQVGEIERSLVYFQGLAADAERERQEVDTIASANNDVTINLPVTLKDYGKVRPIKLTYKWHCRECRRGGERNYNECPQCHGPVAHNVSKELHASVPDNPFLVLHVRLEGEGYHDSPHQPPGDVLVRFTRPS